MNFAELRFWLLLAGGLFLALVVRIGIPTGSRDRYDRVALALIGMSLLMAVSWLTFVVYAVVMGVTYLGLLWIGSHPGRRAWALPLVAVQLAPLLFYKYGDFLATDVLRRPDWVAADLVIPVGISFYTFQKVAFVIDTVHRGQSLPGFLDYANFAGFFPQIVAGPIERREDLLPQMQKFRFRWDPAALDLGASWIVVGLFLKMCLADNLAVFLQRDAGSNAYLIWFNNLLFALRIYFDFAGYSLVALGLGACLGVRLTLNFASPYLAASPGEFWRRWHITLSQWFRDYVYIPMGGNRVRRWALNILIVFAVSGLWHGAGWNFVAWGLFHGLLLVVAAVWWPKGRGLGWLGLLLTLAAVLFSWMLFYETRTDVLIGNLRTLASPVGYSKPALDGFLGLMKSANGVVALAFIALSGAVFLLEARSLARGEPYSEFRRPWVQATLVVLTVLLSPGVSNGFIYFAF
jgi:D-alanyl-lipoteichoic acid acyltransferase DltB (MBOAT superfamily)